MDATQSYGNTNASVFIGVCVCVLEGGETVVYGTVYML